VDGERISLLSYNSWAPSPAPLNYNVFRALVVAFSGNANITLVVYARLVARAGHAESARVVRTRPRPSPPRHLRGILPAALQAPRLFPLLGASLARACPLPAARRPCRAADRLCDADDPRPGHRAGDLPAGLEVARSASAAPLRARRVLRGDEFTTGDGRRSGRRRRLHGHYLVKGLPADQAAAIEALTRETWAAITGAWVVEAAPLASPGAALAYLGLHHRKPQQAPPAEWRGMTDRPSKRYWHRPIAELRALARAELAVEAHAHRTGLPLELAAAEVAAREPARLLEVRRLGDGALLEPLGEFSGRLPDETRAAIVAARRRWR
jgi:hypothetical protein